MSLRKKREWIEAQIVIERIFETREEAEAWAQGTVDDLEADVIEVHYSEHSEFVRDE